MNEKTILLQVAMEIECQEILKKLTDLEELIINGYKFYKGKIYNYPIIISLSKVGLINASASVMLAIKEFNPKIIINTGIAGATDKNMHIGDIVIFGNFININSYRTKKLKKGEGSNSNEWELITFLSGEEDRLVEEKATISLVEIAKETIKNDYGNIYVGKIGSGDIWNSEYDRIVYLNENYNILCEDMETIATYTIANKNNIDTISIKMISDNILIEEDYNREIGKNLEKIIINYLNEIINN